MILVFGARTLCNEFLNPYNTIDISAGLGRPTGEGIAGLGARAAGLPGEKADCERKEIRQPF
jgi:hypothetical protein